MTPFDRCMEVVAKWEGGWSDHPADNGGATRWGITIGTLTAWRGKPVTKTDVRKLTKAEAREIYRAWYWQVIRGDDLPLPVALMTFDAAVNSGAGRAARWLQQAVGVDEDGFIGPQTLAAVQRANVLETVQEMRRIREAFLRRLDDWPVFGNGWMNRVADVTDIAVKMAGGGIKEIPPAAAPGGLIAAIVRLLAAIFGRKG